MQEKITHITVIKATGAPRDAKAMLEGKEISTLSLSAEGHAKAKVKRCPAHMPQSVTELMGLSPSLTHCLGLWSRACFSPPGTQRCCMDEGGEGLGIGPKEKV